MRDFPIPCLWNSGNTEIGPIPYQRRVPSEKVTGEKAMWPTTFPLISATRDTVSALAARKALTINCSVCWLYGWSLKAALVTSNITSASDFISLRIMMFIVSPVAIGSNLQEVLQVANPA